LKEAQKLGFSSAAIASRSKLDMNSGLEIRQMADLTTFVGDMFGAG
jgi:DNA repair protein RadA/Sms